MIHLKNNINNLISDIESGYGVSEWIHNGYAIWPVLRIYLYMALLKRKENRRSDSDNRNSHLFFKMKGIVLSLKDLLFISNKKVNKVYIGARSHCVNYNGVQFNRYFDPILDTDESSSLYFSKADSKKGVYKPKRHFLISPIKIVFSTIDKIFGSYSLSTHYIQELCDILESKGIRIEGFEEILKSKIRTVDISYAMFRFLFKKMKPEQVWVLCYYSADMLGMLIAAHKLSIPTIDMQHGGQGRNHLAYCNWTNVPEDGYEALPDYFYTWDKSSAKLINVWAQKSNKHSAKVFGNPWVDGWKKEKFRQSNYVWPENIILYTLQPTGEPLEEFILETIQKTKDNWNWWLRLHPRQMNEKEKIFSRLKEKGLLNSVNIEEASLLPLPEILLHTNVHITKFSGCALEAYQFDVPSIIIDQRGVDIYKEYIDDINGVISASLAQNSQKLLKDIETVYYEKAL